MKKKGFIILGIVIVLIIVLIDSISPKDIDWSPTYHEKHTQPFGLKVFHDQLNSIFKLENVLTLKNTFYEYQQEHSLSTLTPNNIYINIDLQYAPDPTSENSLLKFIAKGNTAFISANSFSKNLLDSLKIQKNFHTKSLYKVDSIKVSLQQKSLTFDNKLKFQQSFFKDSTNVKSLGKIIGKSKDSIKVNETNFVKINYKKGFFYLHTQPEIFTNYHLLQAKNTNYINAVLSCLPTAIINQKNKENILINTKNFVYFESNYKTDDELINDPLRFIKKQKELYAAWILLLVAIGIYLFINAKRKQRIIPIIPKVKNTSLNFVETIATLYEEADNFQPIIHHKINIFYKNIRNTYNIITDKTNLKLAEQLSLKSGYDLQKTKELIRFINTLKNRESSSFTLLKKLNKEIEDFNKNTNAWKN
ncbi:DUF4350 domain-containing protein [Wenyingzhuangia sp. IMCC45467]